MNFEENLKNFRFTDDSRDVFDACLGFAAFLEKNGIKELQIYIDDAFKFYAASTQIGRASCRERV